MNSKYTTFQRKKNALAWLFNSIKNFFIYIFNKLNTVIILIVRLVLYIASTTDMLLNCTEEQKF